MLVLTTKWQIIDDISLVRYGILIDDRCRVFMT